MDVETIRAFGDRSNVPFKSLGEVALGYFVCRKVANPKGDYMVFPQFIVV